MRQVPCSERQKRGNALCRIYRGQAVVYGNNIGNQKQQIMMSQKYVQPSLFPEEELQEDTFSGRKEYDLTILFERLAKSDFRSRFHLSKKDREYVMEKGLPTIQKHAEDFVAKRLAPQLLYLTTASRHPCVDILFSWLNMPLAAVAEDASSSGIISRQAGH